MNDFKAQDYDSFVLQNTIKVNKYLNYAMWFFVVTGPAIAAGIKGGFYRNISYGTCINISLIISILALVHYFLLRKYPKSIGTGMFALTALDILLVYMNCYHVNIYLTWFLIPILSLLFVNRPLYIYSVVLNYIMMFTSTWITAPYYASLRSDHETAISYFKDIMGGYTVETFIMITSTYVIGKLTAGYFVDIFKQYEIFRENENLKILSKTAVAASEAKSAFLSNMSHEIRTPINAVLGMNEMILRESSEPEIIGYSNTIRNAGNTLLGLVNDILDFSKIEAGKMEIIPVEYGLSSLINDLVNMIKIKADEKGLDLRPDFDTHIPRILFGDEIRIKQVVTNILTNAVKYTNKGQVFFGIGYEKSEEDPDSIILKVTVKDTGIGIKPEDMKKLFSEFERIEEDRNRSVEGTGLGMSITKKLLEMMGASLKVESVYGEGSSFSFDLKQRVVDWEELGDYESSYRIAVSSMKKYREKFRAPDANILIVDDTETNLDVFRSLLKRTLVHIDTAQSGDECLKLTYESKYDIIFLDHMMPDKDGIETLHEMRSLDSSPNHDTPVICLTANAISGARERYLSEGFNDYLTKPIEADKLEDLLIYFLPQDKVMITAKGDEADTDIPGIEEEPLPGWLYDCIDLNITEGLGNCGGTGDYLTILNGFHASIGVKADEIEGYYRSDDIRNYTIKVHALKSSARTIGALTLSEMASRLEDAGDNNDTEYIHNNTDDLLKLYRSYTDILAPLDATADGLPDIPPEVLSDAYSVLGEFAETMDYDLSVMILDSVKEYCLSPEDTDRFGRIRACLSQMDWDGIKEILSVYRNTNDQITGRT